ncbi:hypothetical protein KORDIASMS9_02931 [Kordia sp. SMS9]|uniref:T9SS type A sorting domain-containing protein n=1 Tax=Kordia sp. SMS9 TaxID=2282170 RepID=UPI000E0CDE98|nr:T9SS type A sorting domain-containing protein [Kordia sp. SMS9]AXG70685.1 hypothetical protein KORDIASMS9_02931 [Kordia sp. SMS9]
MNTLITTKNFKLIVCILYLLPQIGFNQNTTDIPPLSVNQYSELNQIRKINDPTTLKKFQDIKRGVARLCYNDSDFNCVNGFLVNNTNNLHDGNQQIKELFFITENLNHVNSGDKKVYLSFDFELPGTDANQNDLNTFTINRMYEVEVSEIIETNRNVKLYKITFDDAEQGDTNAFYNTYVLGWDIGDNSIKDQYLSNISHYSSGLGNARSSYKSIFQNYDGANINNVRLSEGNFLINQADYENLNGNLASLYNILGSPLLNEEGNAVAYANVFPHRYNTIKERWLSYYERTNPLQRTYRPNFIDGLEFDIQHKTWLNKVRGGFLHDLIPNPVDASYDLTINGAESEVITLVSTDFFPFDPRASHLNKYNLIEEYYGDGINAGPGNASQSDVLLYVTPNNDTDIVLYGKQLFPELPLGFVNGTKPFQGKPWFIGQNPYNLPNFPTRKLSILDFTRDTDKIKSNLLDYLRKTNTGGIELLSNFDFPATIHLRTKSTSPTASIRGIRLPHKLPVNAKELFEDGAYNDLWQSYKYKESKYSTQIGNDHLHIESVEINTWDQPENIRTQIQNDPQHPLYPINPIYSKKITTGDNGGYLNLDNLVYKFQTNASLELINDSGLPNDVDSKDFFIEIIITLKKNFNGEVSARAWIDFFNREETVGKKEETVGTETEYTYNFVNDPIAHPIEKIGESQNLYNVEDFNVIRINEKIPAFGIDENSSKLGKKRLRISVKRGATYPEQDSFNENTLGEVEDYLIDVQLEENPNVNDELIARATLNVYAKIYQKGSTGAQEQQSDTDPNCTAGSSAALDALLYDDNGQEDNLGIQRTCSEWVGPCATGGNCSSLYNVDTNAIGDEVINLDGLHYANLDTENIYTTGDFTQGFSVYAKFSPSNPLRTATTQYLYAMGNLDGSSINDGWGLRFIPDNENPAIELVVNANAVVQTYKIPLADWLLTNPNIWIECLVVKNNNKLVALVKNNSTNQLKRESITLYNKAMSISAPTTLGGVAWSTYDNFNGKIDQFIFWDTPLNERDQDIFMDVENTISPTGAEICEAIADKTLISIQNTSADRYDVETPPVGADPNSPPTNPNAHDLALQNGEYVPQGANSWEGYYINSLFQDNNPIEGENEVTILQVPKPYMMSRAYTSLGGSSFPNPEGGDDDDDFDNDPANNYAPLIPQPSDNLGFDPQNPNTWNYWAELDKLNSEIQQLIREWRKVSSTAGVNFIITANDNDRQIFKSFANHINTFSGALNIVRGEEKISDYLYLLYSWDQEYGILNNIPQVNVYRTLLRYVINYHSFFDQLADCYQQGECEIDLTDNLTTIALDWFGVIVPDTVIKRVINTVFTLTGLPDVGKVAVIYQSKGSNNEVTVGVKHDGSLYFETKLNNVVRDIQSVMKIPLNKEVEITTTFNDGMMTASIGGIPIQDTAIHPEESINYTNFTEDGNGSCVGGPCNTTTTTLVDADVKINRIFVLNETLSQLEKLNITNCTLTNSNAPNSSRDSDNQTVKIDTEQDATEDTKVQTVFALFPNPVKEELNIMLEVQQEGLMEVEIFDMTGRKVYTQSWSEIDKGHHLITLRQLNLSDGSYIVKIKAGDINRTEQIIIKR